MAPINPSSFLMGDSIYQPDDKNLLMEAISDVIQAIPGEHGILPLQMILEELVSTINMAISLSLENQNESKSILIIHLGYLTSCCKGLQISENPKILLDLTKSSKIEDNVSMYESYQSISDGVWQMVEGICRIFGSDSEIMEVNIFAFTSADFLTSPCIFIFLQNP